MRKIYIIGAMACLFAACKPSVNVNKTAVSGDVDFSNYLAIGNSYTAGYADASLTVSGQLNSYPQRLFEQFALIQNRGAKGPFVHPLLHSDNGYPSPKKILGLVYNYCNPQDSMWSAVDYPNYVPDPIDPQLFVSPANSGQINNIGVPGLRVVDYPVAGYALQNKYAERFFNNTFGTPLDQLAFMVHNLHPTFFTLWMGTDDIMGYALSGGQGDGTGTAVPLALNYYNPNDISPYTTFEKIYDTALTVAISTGASGALINIPDVASLPFFTTVPANGLRLNTEEEAANMQAYYATSTWNKVFQVGANYFIIRDHNGNVRQAVPGELILLSIPMDSIKCAGWGSTTPIPEQYVLTTDELQHIRAAVTRFNGFIKFEAQLHNLAYVDMNTYLSQVASGITYNGIKYNAQFVAGGAFSLDGIHPTPRGYALIANKISSVINDFYHSTIPVIDVNKHPGVKFP